MMRLPRFAWHAPVSVAEAARILDGEGPAAQPVAGGTDLYPNMKRRHQTPATLVSLRRIEALRGVEWTESAGDGPARHLRIGPCETLTAVSRHPLVRDRFPALAHAAGAVSTPILRNMGTIGGNLCLDTRCLYYNQNHEWRKAINFCLKFAGDTCWVAPSSETCLAVNSSDTVPVFCVAGARLRLVSAWGEREVAAEELYVKDGIHYMKKEPGEILTDILLPDPGGRRDVYRKLARRGAFDFPVLGVAAGLRTDGAGVVTEARIVLNAVASAPLRASEAEAALLGRPLSAESIAAAAERAYVPAKPMDNTDLNYAWRKTMVKVEVARALRELGTSSPGRA